MTNIEIAIKLAEEIEHDYDNLIRIIKADKDDTVKILLINSAWMGHVVSYDKKLKVFIYKDTIIPVSKEFLAMVNKCLNIEQPSPTFQKGGPTPTNNEPTPKVNSIISEAYIKKVDHILIVLKEYKSQMDKVLISKSVIDKLTEELNEMNPFN